MIWLNIGLSWKITKYVPPSFWCHIQNRHSIPQNGLLFLLWWNSAQSTSMRRIQCKAKTDKAPAWLSVGSIYRLITQRDVQNFLYEAVLFPMEPSNTILLTSVVKYGSLYLTRNSPPVTFLGTRDSYDSRTYPSWNLRAFKWTHLRSQLCELLIDKVFRLRVRPLICFHGTFLCSTK